MPSSRCSTLLDIVIPATRRSVNHLLWSISQGVALPSRVIVVTNEVTNVESFSPYYPTEVISFNSREHPIGDADQGLRRNIGIWASDAEYVMTLDDDVFAPKNLVLSAIEEVQQQRVVWGHHRFIDFEPNGERLLTLEPEAGRSREQGVNRKHLWYSCYAGLMVAERQLLLDVGGYDLAFLCRHGNEDQNLGRRLNHLLDRGDEVWVSEPPFAWHPNEERTHASPRNNFCGTTNWLEETSINGVRFLKCNRPSCPYRIFAGTEDEVFSDRLIIAYDPSTITLKKERI
jgi:hypothetical protein